MKGIIRENLGESRYIVGVPLAVQPLADEIEKYQKLYQATIPKITDAFKALAEAREGYALLLAAVTNAASDYELCRLDFSSTSCIEAGQTACLNAYSAAESTCYEIESGVGECDPDCQRERARCIAAAARVRDACLAKVATDCAELEYQHIQECQETHAPIIAAAQAAALEKLPAIQEAMYVLQTEQAIQFSLARKLNELEAIAAREYQITCFRAQWDTELAVGTEVEMAKTPNGRHAITGIITAPTPCLHDSRVLPSGHLFVNAALYPGFETWRPTWRVGTVKEIIAPDLKIQFAPANLAGSLGTLYSENPLDCTPPQIYFDGVDPKTAEANIVTARNALKDAQQALLDAVKIQNDCIAEFDQAWMDQCYGTAVEICDESYSASIEPALQDRATCYADGPDNCEESVAAGLEACEAAFRPAIEEKQGLVDAAQLVVTETAQELVDAQQALADIEAEIQVCVDAINTQEWLDAESDLLDGLCDEAADSKKQQCLDNGGTAANCQVLWESYYSDCVSLIEEQLPIRQAAAIAKCRDDRQADLDAAENAIDAAYYPAMQAELLMGQAEDALAAAEKDLADCNKNWDLAECIASAMAVCDDTYAQATDLFTLQKAACYQEAMAECDRQRDEAIDACYAANAAAISGAQQGVEAAVRDVEIATNGRYNPADPLILEVPVAHCSASGFRVDDEVLIDFPVRSGATAMAVWDSRRVIGWASETRACGDFTLAYAGMCSVKTLSLSMVRTWADAEIIYGHLSTGRYVVQAAKHNERTAEPVYQDYPLTHSNQGDAPTLFFGNEETAPYLSFRFFGRGESWKGDECLNEFEDNDQLPISGDVIHLKLTDRLTDVTITDYKYVYFRFLDTQPPPVEPPEIPAPQVVASGAVHFVNPYLLARNGGQWLRFDEIRIVMANTYKPTALDVSTNPNGCWIEEDCTTGEEGAPPVIPITVTSLADL